MKKATFDQSGVITAFYDPEIHKGMIPSDSIEMAEDDWLRCISEPNRWVIQGGKLVQAPFPAPAEALAQEARTKRNALLAASDWTQVADAPVDQAAWATYRQALRDITEQAGFPTDINWPVQPV